MDQSKPLSIATLAVTDSICSGPSTSCCVYVILTLILMSALQHSCHILETGFGDVYTSQIQETVKLKFVLDCLSGILVPIVLGGEFVIC